jgi:hypothetical protein
MSFVFQTFFTEKSGEKFKKKFTSFELPFEFFTSNSKNSENILSFSATFSVKNV